MEDKDLNINLEITNFKLQANPKIIANEKTVPIGHETANQLHILECIKHGINSPKVQKPHVAAQLIHNFVASLVTEYPTLVHFAIAREALKDEDIKGIDRRSKEYKDIVIQVATLINEHCQKLKVYLSPQKPLKEAFDATIDFADSLTGTISALNIIDCSEAIPSIDSCFEKNKIFLIDDKFLSYLKKIGKNSKDLATELKHNFLEHYASFKKTGNYPLSFWFNLPATPEQPIFFSYAMICLAKAIWRDEVSRRAKLIVEGVPAIIKNDQEHIIDMVSHDKKIQQTDEQIQVFSRGRLLGEIPIPMIPAGAIGAILNGINKMNLVEGHRVLRYVTRTAFNQAIAGHADHRIITRESFRVIASELGLKGERSIKDMITVFQAMAYFEFKRPSFSGNLIALKKFMSAKTHRLDGVEITVGTMLLPYRASEDFKNGESKLMIPILSDPLLVGSNQYHAGQYLLQMLVMAEFVRQSVDFAKHGCIKIPMETWQKMAQECGVSSIIEKILDRWTRDDSDGPKFLEKIDKDFYTLGSSYQKEIDFLIRQGNYRITRSIGGKTSATKRAKAKNNTR